MATKEEVEKLGVADVMEAKPFSLPPLPYSVQAMEPVISAKTMSVHYGKHHATYVKKLNELVQNTEFANMSLEDVVKKSQGPTFNNAAQHWNHTFFWKIMSPQTTSGPTGAIQGAIDKSFGSYEAFKEKFVATATGQFGSGWAWLVKKQDGSVVCEGTPNGVNPISTGSGKPVLGLDVWEHAYYLDYMQDRAGYVKAFFSKVNWDAVNQHYESN